MEFSREDILFACTNTEELHLIILPTEKCNFRCSYCYEDFIHGRMKDETVEAVTRLLARRIQGLSHLTIDWFGGEPLLGFPVIRKINAFAQALITQQDPRAWFQSSITTNAFLLNKKVFQELVKLGVYQFQITLDGPRELHNKTRIQANGGETFDTIWNNLCALQESKERFEVLLRLHLMRSNVDHVQRLIDSINTQFEEDERFKVFLKPIENLGGPNAKFCSSQGLNDPEAAVEHLGVSIKNNGRFWEPNPMCHASKFNSLIIRSDGRIGKCTTALEDPANTIGNIRPDGTLSLDRDKVVSWSRGVYSMKSEDLYCPYRSIKAEGQKITWIDRPA